MRLSGFTFIRSGTRLGYPFIESIRSALPVVDEFVVALGPSDDDTAERLHALARGEGQGKLRIIDSCWNARAPRGFVYAAQSMVALYNCVGDWALYVQGDEVLHEDDLPTLREALERASADPRVEGLALDFLHFYGSPSVLANSPAWYRREVRVVRNTGLRLVMPSDGQYFTAISGRGRLRYLRCAVPGVRMFHYGWTRGAAHNLAKHVETRPYYNGDATPEPPTAAHASAAPRTTGAPPRDAPTPGAHAGDSYGRIDPTILRPFTGTHPRVVQPWLDTSASRTFHPDPHYRLTSRDRRQRFKMIVEKTFGVDWSKRHYIEV